MISIEPQMHKLTAIFDRLAYPLPTDNLRVPGWSQRIVNRTGDTLNDRARFADSGVQGVLRQIHDIETSYAQLFSARDEPRSLNRRSWLASRQEAFFGEYERPIEGVR